MSSGEPFRARIVWPALGFPAVIKPRVPVSSRPWAEGDATRCLCLLLICNRPRLTKAEVAQHVRYVKWHERGRRHIRAGMQGSFREGQLEVPRPVKHGRGDRLGQHISFGANADGRNGIVASLARHVTHFYQRAGMQYLYEIRVYESAISHLTEGCYHLFINNATDRENAPSDEMALLLRNHAVAARTGPGMQTESLRQRLLEEYEYEFGTVRLYGEATRAARVRSEVLHPFFIRPRLGSTLEVAQLTDTHVDVRADVYAQNLASEIRQGVLAYNNWNTGFTRTYAAARGTADVLLLTGDLIDYGRGHVGGERPNDLGDDAFYHVDRNWFLFTRLLAAGKVYSRPVYTILGNHDWRLNPYPPFAFGAPEAATLLHDAARKSKAEQERLLRMAHGRGHEPKLSYVSRAEALLAKPGRTLLQAVRTVLLAHKTLDMPKFPTETTVQSVAWYLLTINPFLDYSFTLPGGHQILMLDWAEDENVQLGAVYKGMRYHAVGSGAAVEGPTARNSLTDLQKRLVEGFTESPGRARIVAIHAPPIGPWSNWPDDELRRGWKTFDQGGRGYPYYRAETADGKTIQGHPFFAIRPAKGIVPDAVWGMDASYNSFERHRPWFIERVARPASGVRLVLSGHIHRRGLFVTYKAGAAQGAGVAGNWLIRQVPDRDAHDVRFPAAARTRVPGSGSSGVQATGPLYVNSTSVGPRGHAYPTARVHGYLDAGYTRLQLQNNGTIRNVSFEWVKAAQSPVVAAPAVRVPSGRVPARQVRPTSRIRSRAPARSP